MDTFIGAAFVIASFVKLPPVVNYVSAAYGVETLVNTSLRKPLQDGVLYQSADDLIVPYKTDICGSYAGRSSSATIYNWYD